MYVFQTWKNMLDKEGCVCPMFMDDLEKQRAIRASAGGVGGVFEWAACQRGCYGWNACVSDVLARVARVVCLREWHASVGGMSGMLVWVTLVAWQHDWCGWRACMSGVLA